MLKISTCKTNQMADKEVGRTKTEAKAATRQRTTNEKVKKKVLRETQQNENMENKHVGGLVFKIVRGLPRHSLVLRVCFSPAHTIHA